MRSSDDGDDSDAPRSTERKLKKKFKEFVVLFCFVFCSFDKESHNASNDDARASDAERGVCLQPLALRGLGHCAGSRMMYLLLSASVPCTFQIKLLMLALGKRRLGIAVHIRTQASSSSSRLVHTLHRRACQLALVAVVN